MGLARFVLAVVLGFGVLCGYGSAIGHSMHLAHHGAAHHGSCDHGAP